MKFRHIFNLRFLFSIFYHFIFVFSFQHLILERSKKLTGYYKSEKIKSKIQKSAAKINNVTKGDKNLNVSTDLFNDEIRNKEDKTEISSKKSNKNKNWMNFENFEICVLDSFQTYGIRSFLNLFTENYREVNIFRSFFYSFFVIIYEFFSGFYWFWYSEYSLIF